jgi:hypothetical protein
MICSRTITTGALATRVRRRLARDGQLLRRCWPWSDRLDELGEFYVLAAGTHDVVARHVEIEHLASELQVLSPDEIVED